MRKIKYMTITLPKKIIQKHIENEDDFETIIAYTKTGILKQNMYVDGESGDVYTKESFLKEISKHPDLWEDCTINDLDLYSKGTLFFYNKYNLSWVTPDNKDISATKFFITKDFEDIKPFNPIKIEDI